MNNDSELFDRAVRQFDKRRLAEEFFLPRDSIFFQVRQTALARIENFKRRGKCVRPLPPILFDLTDSSYLDAFAFNYESHGLIALSGAGVAIFHNAMFCLLSRPDLLKEIGNPSEECSELSQHPLPIDLIELARHYARKDASVHFYVPRNDIRQSTALVMAMLAMEFVIAHEFRHIQAGHIAFWGQVTGQSLIKEVNSENTDPTLAMISQAMEMDADCYGIRSALDLVLRAASHPHEFGESWRIAIPDEKKGLFLALVSAYIIFKMFDLVESTSMNWQARTHPPAAMRNTMLMAAADECFIQWQRPDLVEWLSTVASRIVEIGEQEIGILTGIPSNIQNLIQINGQEGGLHVNKILDTWAAIKSQIAPFSYVTFRGLSKTGEPLS